MVSEDRQQAGRGQGGRQLDKVAFDILLQSGPHIYPLSSPLFFEIGGQAWMNNCEKPVRRWEAGTNVHCFQIIYAHRLGRRGSHIYLHSFPPFVEMGDQSLDK